MQALKLSRSQSVPVIIPDSFIYDWLVSSNNGANYCDTISLPPTIAIDDEEEEKIIPSRIDSIKCLDFDIETSKQKIYKQQDTNLIKSLSSTQQKIKVAFLQPYHSLNSSPAPKARIGMRVAHAEYYGDEFGTIRWIGRVPQISEDWTVGIEFDNAIGETDGSLNGRRYFIAKDCFAKFLALSEVRIVDEHVGRPEPGTMISVMSAQAQPGQMISIQRVSTVHVQHCFLNAPHRRPGDYLLAVNTRLHCQCPNCGPCAHIIMPPRVQRIAPSKNATHMCQFSHYSCCQTDFSCSQVANSSLTHNCSSANAANPSQEYTFPEDEEKSLGFVQDLTALGNADLPPVANSWIAGAGYLSRLQQQQQSKLELEVFPLKQSSSKKRGDHVRTSFDSSEPLDSTLEADIERLSLARYGRPTRGKSSPRTKGMGILASLRTLIVCPNRQSQPSQMRRHHQRTYYQSTHFKNSKRSHHNARRTINSCSNDIPINSLDGTPNNTCCSDSCFVGNDFLVEREVKLNSTPNSLESSSTSTDGGISLSSTPSSDCDENLEEEICKLTSSNLRVSEDDDELLSANLGKLEFSEQQVVNMNHTQPQNITINPY